MSQLLGTQLDKETLATCIGMIESGVNPEALAVGVYYTHPETKIKLEY
jgi:mitotic-spindle organizing protein 1